MSHRSSAFLLFIAALFSGESAATELKDSTFGFRLDIPDGFTKVEADPPESDTLYKYVDREPTPDDPALVLQIQRLRGVIDSASRMKESEIPRIEGITVSLQDFTWKDSELDVMRQAFVLPSGLEYVVFGIQYPLSGEAVQLQVGGPASDELKIYSLFCQIALRFENTKPLYSARTVSVRKLSKEDRTRSLIGGVLKLTITAIVVVFLFRIVKRAFSSHQGNQ